MNFRRPALALMILLMAAFSSSAADEPVADSATVVVQGHARFTVLGPRLIRMEWSEDGRFEDRPTLGVVNRRMPVPEFSVKRSSGKMVLQTEALTLTYSGDGKFSAENLAVTFRMADSASKEGERTVSWHPRMDDGGNLLGTVRTLDSCDGVRTVDPFDDGVVSRDGWTVVDESARQVFVPEDTDWKYWVANREPGERLDLYLFAYGHDYKAAVSDFVKIGGKIPMPPKYAFGKMPSAFMSKLRAYVAQY